MSKKKRKKKWCRRCARRALNPKVSAMAANFDAVLRTLGREGCKAAAEGDLLRLGSVIAFARVLGLDVTIERKDVLGEGGKGDAPA